MDFKAAMRIGIRRSNTSVDYLCSLKGQYIKSQVRNLLRTSFLPSSSITNKWLSVEKQEYQALQTGISSFYHRRSPEIEISNSIFTAPETALTGVVLPCHVFAKEDEAHQPALWAGINRPATYHTTIGLGVATDMVDICIIFKIVKPLGVPMIHRTDSLFRV
ncbi:hypothetical protein E4U55_002061 [Claviceps digitariae]|nr:hypothetical protein E4U55_002061 [Claviceps digitariae]